MTFQESITTCFRKYADFTGRASRSEYWWFILFYMLASAAGSMIRDVVGGLISIAFLLPILAAACRRLHDTIAAVGGSSSRSCRSSALSC